MNQSRTWTFGVALLVCALTQAANAQRRPSDSDVTGTGPDGRPTDIVNGNFDSGLAGWTWAFDTNPAGQFTADGQAAAMPELNQPAENMVLNLSNSVQLPVTQFDDRPASRPGSDTPFGSDPGSTDGAPAGPDIVSVVNAEQVFDFTDGDVLIAFTSVAFGIEVAEASNVRLSASMQLENLTSGNTCMDSILDYAFEWPCDTMIAIDGQSGWQLHQIDIASCGALPGDTLKVKFTLQITVNDDNPNTVVHLYSQAMIDDVRILTVLDMPQPPDDLSNDRPASVLLTVQAADGFTDGQAAGGPRSDGFEIETGGGAVIDCGDGGDTGNGRISLGTIMGGQDSGGGAQAGGTGLSQRG